MKVLSYTGQAILAVFIIFSGLQLGAAIYEATVVTPLWSGSLPESVTNWNTVPQFAINPGIYWGKATPLYALCSVLMLIFAWFMPTSVRNLMLFAGVLSFLVFIVTITFFIPILMKTIAVRGAGLSGDEITRLAHQWVSWNWLRLASVIAALLAAIWALAIPKSRHVVSIESI